MKLIFYAALLTVLLAGVIPVSAQEAGQPAVESAVSVDENGSQNDSAAVKATSDEPRKIVAYYFHSTRRCASCRKIESYSAEIIRTAFENEMDQGLLEWRLVNTDESVNKHFIKDYELYTKSLVLSEIVNGDEVRWKNLDKIWVLLKDKESFQKYVKGEVRAFLKEN